MTTATKLNAALRFWQSRYDSLATEVDQLRMRHQSLEDLCDRSKRQAVDQHKVTLAAEAMAGESLIRLHSHLVAHNRYAEQTTVHQSALSRQIEEKRSHMLVLKRKLKQVESIRDTAERKQASAAQRRIDEEAAYLHLIRRQD